MLYAHKATDPATRCSLKQQKCSTFSSDSQNIKISDKQDIQSVPPSNIQTSSTIQPSSKSIKHPSIHLHSSHQKSSHQAIPPGSGSNHLDRHLGTKAPGTSHSEIWDNKTMDVYIINIFINHIYICYIYDIYIYDIYIYI